MVFDGLDNRAALEMLREDFRAARESRMEIEDRKLRDYKLYRRFRDDVLPEGGTSAEDKGPHGWSKLTVPLVFWIVETILPRIGVQPPTLTVTPGNPQSVRYTQGKQLRMQRQLKRGASEKELLDSMKQFLILGDGPIKMSWSNRIGGPRLMAVDWFDWFLSPDARRWFDAEVIWHRTWHTRRDLQALLHRDQNRVDINGDKLPPQYDKDALERLIGGGSFREIDDPIYQSRREASGLGPQEWGNGEGQMAILEGWYRDGSVGWIAGDDSPTLIRILREPMYTDPKGYAFRPWGCLQNTPDLFLPYSISDAEMLEDHQHEASTFRNAGIDQATGNINSPKGYNAEMVRPEDLRRAFEEPNGTFAVNGNPREAVETFAPGAVSPDFERIYEMMRSEAQMISGVSDISAGQPTAFGLDNSTATGMSIIREEANQRYRMKLKLIDISMQPIAQIYDWMDRALSMESIHVPVERGFKMMPDAAGMRMDESKSFATVDTAVNGADLDYEITVDAGAMAPPHQMQQAQEIRGLIMDLSHQMIAPMVDWPAVARMLVEAHGQMAEKILAQGPPPVPIENVTEDGDIPVGPPVPVDDGSGPVPEPAPGGNGSVPTPL